MEHHPNVHSAWQSWSEDQQLHIAIPYSNPWRWRTRRELLHDCVRHLVHSPNVVVHLGELAYGDRDFEVTGPAGIGASLPEYLSGKYHEIQVRTQCELFHKENLTNVIVGRSFPQKYKYGGYCDGDFHFTRHDWALETIHQLQHHAWVQPFSSYADLSGAVYGQAHQPLRVNATFAYNWIRGGYQLPEGWSNGGWKKPGAVIEDGYGGLCPPEQKKVNRYVGATGGCWCFTSEGFNATGGLLDTCILGHGDWFMTFGLVGEEAPDVGASSYTAGYLGSIHKWQQDAARLKKNIGYTDNFAVHHFHGSKYRRFYGQRYKILIDHKFDPNTDLRRDWQGIWQLTGDKPALRDAIRAYFIERSEDSTEIFAAGGERPMI